MNPERIKSDARAALEECRGIARKAYDEGRDLTRSESSRVDELMSDAKRMKRDIDAKAVFDDFVGKFDLLPPNYPSRSHKGGVPGITRERFALPTADLKSLHAAATSGHYARKTVSTTQSPMSVVGHYDLTPIPFARDAANLADYIPKVNTPPNQTPYGP